jgi:tetratricopeptide (TPR) repeat protein
MSARRHTHESAISALSLSLVGIIVCAIFMLGMRPDLKASLLDAHLPGQSPPRAVAAQPHAPAVAGETRPAPADPRLAEIEMRFEQAVVMLHARRYEEAIVALERVIALSPRLPEAYVNLGYALLGLERYDTARDFFLAATELQPYQGNAYWGLAVALEALSDLEGALGAMRTYVHLAPPDDPFVRQARSALWEWDTQLSRGPLPEHERQWIEDRTREWVDRNLPDRDAPPAPDLAIPVGR